MLRYLRIIVALTSLVACMLLIALWVRSYRWHDCISGDVGQTYSFNLSSFRGRLGFCDYNYPQEVPLRLYTVQYPFPESRLVESSLFYQVIIPYWEPAIAIGVLAALLGIRRPFQFSLRTLLIAMTIIAAWLGLIGWLV